MYRDIANLKRANKQVRVRITEVNMAARIIWAESRGFENLQYQINVSSLDPLVSIPRVGELWIIQGSSDHDWALLKRLEDGSEDTPLDILREGDRRIDASCLYIDTDRGTIANTQLTLVDQQPEITLPREEGGEPFLYRPEGVTLLSVNGELIVLTPDGKHWKVVLEPYELS